MLTKLSNIAEVISGHTFRGSVKGLSGGNLNILQAKDISGLEINLDNLPATNDIPSSSKAILKTGDVVLTARGRFHSAAVNFRKPIVASSSILIVRPTNSKIDSLYLSVYLNSDKCQTDLHKLAKGSSIKTLNKTDLEQLDVPIPIQETQKLIGYLYINISKQRNLLEKWISTNKSLAEASLLKSTN